MPCGHEIIDNSSATLRVSASLSAPVGIHREAFRLGSLLFLLPIFYVPSESRRGHTGETGFPPVNRVGVSRFVASAEATAI